MSNSKVPIHIIDVIICPFVIPIVLLSFCILYIWKQFIVCIAKLFKPSLTPLSTCCDALVSSEAKTLTKNPKFVSGNIGWMISLNGRLDENWLRDKFYNSFLKGNQANYFNYFTTLVQFGGYNFRKCIATEETIDMNLHIHEVKLPENVPLEQFIGTWFDQPYKPNQPLWEVVLISVADKTVLVYKFHHSLGDGYTMMNWLDVMTNTETPYIIKEFNDSYLDKLKLLITTPRVCCNYYWEIYKIIKDVPVHRLTSPRSPAIFTTLTIELKDFKLIRKKTGVNFLSIMLSLIAGTIRRVMIERHEKTPDSKSKHKNQDYTLIPFALPWPNHPKPKMANHWTGAQFKVPLKEMSAYERLMEVDQYYQYCLENHTHKLLYLYNMPFASVFPTPILEFSVNWMKKIQFGGGALIGSEQTLEINGCQINSANLLFGQGLNMGGLGIGSYMFSYSGQLNCTLIGTNDVVESKEHMETIIKSYYLQEFQELLSSVS